MLKNINHPHIFMRDLPDLERREHGLKKAPTKAEMLKMEKKEHGLKKTPSMSQLMKVEMKEHIKPDGNVIVGKGYKGRARAK
jgi:hypothetical protein